MTSVCPVISTPSLVHAVLNATYFPNPAGDSLRIAISSYLLRWVETREKYNEARDTALTREQRDLMPSRP